MERTKDAVAALVAGEVLRRLLVLEHVLLAALEADLHENSTSVLPLLGHLRLPEAE
jgi:hypothetical protein